MVDVNKFSRMSHFIPSKKINDAVNVTNLFFDNTVEFHGIPRSNMVNYHGIPRSIISNRDGKFNNHFSMSLWKKLDITFSFSSTHHP